MLDHSPAATAKEEVDDEVACLDQIKRNKSLKLLPGHVQKMLTKLTGLLEAKIGQEKGTLDISSNLGEETRSQWNESKSLELLSALVEAHKDQFPRWPIETDSTFSLGNVQPEMANLLHFLVSIYPANLNRLLFCFKVTILTPLSLLILPRSMTIVLGKPN